MRLKDDEQRVLLDSTDGGSRADGISEDRHSSILRKLAAYGMLSEDGDVTPRGLHVAASIEDYASQSVHRMWQVNEGCDYVIVRNTTEDPPAVSDDSDDTADECDELGV